ncbi:Regulatory protein RecX [Corynebacterium deserti GIMN1.010]|uniref:Regulatory protein RecX n=1 Tax=Corynebacterium deserti GIMN1.010 TaxID=931089 RepID=A0A0M4CQG0_9CORY|nr:recombination regulator RecX [Corynebacterium deserti]ALC06142.1 Regulatory protein RecX [Corynebacterium deserti GIMN1.010]
MNQLSQQEKLEKLHRALNNFTRAHSRGESDFFDLEHEEKKAEVRRRALLLLNQRARSIHELTTRLYALEFEHSIVDDVVEDLTRSNLLDDESFAMEWVRQRAARRGKSSRVLDKELKEKGVDKHLRDLALAQIDAADERSTARAVAVKKARSETRVPADRHDYDKALRRVLGALARRGFPAGLSMELAREALDERIAGLQE